MPDGRQFTDEQIRLLIKRGAVIGAALDAWMLYPGWIRGQTRARWSRLEAVADHIDHVCQLAGNARHAAIGSDLDGGFGTEQVPAGHGPDLGPAEARRDPLRPRLSSDDIDAIFHGNWLRFFRQHLPE